MARTSALVALVALLGCSAPVAEPAPSAKPRASDGAPLLAPDDVVWVDRVTPAGGESDAQPLPLVVAIHGLGDAPDRFCRLFDDFRARAHVACPRAFAKHGQSGWSWFPPGKKGAEQAADIAAAADRLAAAVATHAASKPTTGKPIVVGFSQGGALSFALAVRHASAVRLAVPVGGWLPSDLRPGAGAAVAPIVALHGEADQRVPIDPTREAIGALVAAGAGVELKTFPGVGHSIPPEVRSALFAAILEALDAPRPRPE
jgi:phospholipase/carboxylesterase